MIKIVALLALFGEGRTQETSEDREFTMPETPVSVEIPADAEFYEQDAQEDVNVYPKSTRICRLCRILNKRKDA